MRWFSNPLISVLLVLSTASAMCMVSCQNRHQENVTMASEPAKTADITSVCQDQTVIVSETDCLKLYKPVFNGGIELLCEYDCHPTEADNRVFVAAGAYTKSYNWSKFEHSLIAGPHIDDKFYEGYDEPANSGAFYYVHSERRWAFVHDGFAKALREVSAVKGQCVGFSQVMLLSGGEMCDIHPRSNPNKLRHRRALCNINHELYVVDSKNKISMSEFAKCLKAIGVIDGLYMDMGSMKYSAYKEFAEGDWIEIHPRNSKTKYCSNYMVFNR